MTPPHDLRSEEPQRTASVRVRSGREVSYNLIDLDTGVLYLDATPVACLDRWSRTRRTTAAPGDTPLGRAS